MLTNTVCWARFERVSYGNWLLPALSWMFRKSKINWEELLKSSVKVILMKYEIKEGTLELDDTDRERSKNAKKLYKLGKHKDKKSGGYFNGQGIIFLLLVTEKVSIPVGFKFYQMDPELRRWGKLEKQLKKKGVKKIRRPKEPKRNPSYPTMNQLGVKLVGGFKENFPEIQIRAVKADALFGTSEFIGGVAQIYPKCQIISQIRHNQKIRVQGKTYHASAYFNGRAAIQSALIIRGEKKKRYTIQA